MAVTTPADVEAVLLRPVDIGEQGGLDRILQLVEAEVLLHLPGYDLGPATTETVTLTGSYGEPLTLPRYPVSAVTAVLVNGVAQVSTAWSFTSKGVLTFLPRVSSGAGPDRWLSSNGPDWEWMRAAPVTVTYTHGQPPAGSPLVLLIAEMAAARVVGAARSGLRSMSVDAYSESYDSAMAGKTIDMRRLARFRRSQGGSIILTR